MIRARLPSRLGSGSTRAEPVVMRTAGIGVTSLSAPVSANDRNPPRADGYDAEPSRLHLYQVCAILSNAEVRF